MTGKKKAIIGVCVGVGVLLIGFLIYFFFIRFSIVGKWEKLKGDPDWLYIKNLEFQSNGDAFVYTTKGDMIKGHFSLTDDNKTLTIFFDKKTFGVFEQETLIKTHPLLRGFDDSFYAPHSRYFRVEKQT